MINQLENRIYVGQYYYEPNGQYLGKGAQGIVYKCYNDNLNIQLCIKIMKIDRQKEERQMREGEISRQLILMENVNLVKIYAFIVQEDKIFIVMEQCEKLQEDLNCFTTQLALEIIKQVVQGYRTLYENNIIHRDIKPSNILQKNGIYKISDFGIAKFIKNGNEKHSSSGTNGYMAPQVFFQEIYTNKADIFSLGMTFYCLIYHRFPPNYKTSDDLIASSLINLIENPIKLQSNEQMGITSAMCELIEKMLKYQENERISWDELFRHPLMQNNYQNFIDPRTNYFRTYLQKIENQQSTMVYNQSLFPSQTWQYNDYTILNHSQIQESASQSNRSNFIQPHVNDNTYASQAQYSTLEQVVQTNQFNPYNFQQYQQQTVSSQQTLSRPIQNNPIYMGSTQTTIRNEEIQQMQQQGSNNPTVFLNYQYQPNNQFQQ